MKNILFILLVFLSLSGFSQLPNYNVTINIYDNADKQIVKTVDVLGKKTKENNNKILFIIFDDGTIEKKIIIGL